jgi:hypothetical protein
MSRSTLEERVANLELQLNALLADPKGAQHVKDWRRTRGAFPGDELIKQVFEEGRKIRRAARNKKQPSSRNGKRRQSHS